MASPLQSSDNSLIPQAQRPALPRTVLGNYPQSVHRAVLVDEFGSAILQTGAALFGGVEASVLLFCSDAPILLTTYSVVVGASAATVRGQAFGSLKDTLPATFGQPAPVTYREQSACIVNGSRTPGYAVQAQWGLASASDTSLQFNLWLEAVCQSPVLEGWPLWFAGNVADVTFPVLLPVEAWVGDVAATGIVETANGSRLPVVGLYEIDGR